MQVIHPPVRGTASQSGLFDSSSRHAPIIEEAPASVGDSKPKTIRKKKVAPAAAAPIAPEPIPTPVKAAKAKPAPPAAAAVVSAEPVKKTKAKKAEAEAKAVIKASVTPESSADEAPAPKPARKARFEKGSEEAKQYMQSLRQKAQAKKAAAAKSE
jgi:hypothetical protein